MFWELLQNHWIRSAQDAANDAAIEGHSTRHYVSALERRVASLELENERLLLAAVALEEILRDDLRVSPERLESKVREIDARDGAFDGKVSVPEAPCSCCGRLIRANRRVCLYCGAPSIAKPVI